MDSNIRQAQLVSQTAVDSERNLEKLALFNAAGTAVGFFTEEAVTGADVVLTGYEAGSAEAVAATDTANEAIAKVEALATADVTGADVALTGYAAGDPDPVAATDTVNEAIAKVEAQAAVDPTGADVVLTGMVAGTAVAVAATDTVNEAIAKLQAQIDALGT